MCRESCLPGMPGLSSSRRRSGAGLFSFRGQGCARAGFMRAGAWHLGWRSAHFVTVSAHFDADCRLHGIQILNLVTDCRQHGIQILNLVTYCRLHGIQFLNLVTYCRLHGIQFLNLVTYCRQHGIQFRHFEARSEQSGGCDNDFLNRKTRSERRRRRFLGGGRRFGSRILQKGGQRGAPGAWSLSLIRKSAVLTPQGVTTSSEASQTPRHPVKEAPIPEGSQRLPVRGPS